SGGTSGSFGRQQHSTNSQWSHQSRPTAASRVSHLAAGGVSRQQDFGDPLQDLERLLNRLLNDADVDGEPQTKSKRHPETFQQSKKHGNVDWKIRQDAIVKDRELRDGVSMRRKDFIGPTTIIVHVVVQSKRLSPAIIKLRNLDSPNRIKVPQEIMITPIHNPATLKQQERQVGREIEITDLRNQRERAPRQSSTAAFGSDASVAGGSQRAVSHRRGKNPLLSLMIKAR
uniref:DUF5641 domain-containing protein n=1 Tax=Macrostomum lignano TaxID=282301 RepID=A0A1I8JFE0_9PLAT